MTHILETERLILRPPELTDAARIQALADDPDVAGMLTPMPYPYTLESAQSWIRLGHAEIESGESYPFVIIRKADNLLIGAVEVGNEVRHQRGEMGYWLGKAYWGQGYVTEAARRVVQFGFEVVGLHRIFATHYAHNPASGRVMQKIGMQYEGTLRGHIVKWDKPVDLLMYAILQDEWQPSQSSSPAS